MKGPCPFETVPPDCPKPGDGRKNQGHLWRIALHPGDQVRCVKCGKVRRSGKRAARQPEELTGQ